MITKVSTFALAQAMSMTDQQHQTTTLAQNEMQGQQDGGTISEQTMLA